jgi:hypothetical protein
MDFHAYFEFFCKPLSQSLSYSESLFAEVSFSRAASAATLPAIFAAKAPV